MGTAMPSDPSVDAWFDDYDNPMKPAVLRVREIILAADPRITESIKWKAPTFAYKGNIASFYPKTRSHVSLMFHQGARIPGEHPILEGEGATSRCPGPLGAGTPPLIAMPRAVAPNLPYAGTACASGGSTITT
jgi:hypothetical protein